MELRYNMNRKKNDMFPNIKESPNWTYNDYGVHLTQCAPNMYIDIDNIFIRQGHNEIPLHKYIHDLMVVAMKEVVNEHCK